MEIMKEWRGYTVRLQSGTVLNLAQVAAITKVLKNGILVGYTVVMKDVYGPASNVSIKLKDYEELFRFGLMGKIK